MSVSKIVRFYATLESVRKRDRYSDLYERLKNIVYEKGRVFLNCHNDLKRHLMDLNRFDFESGVLFFREIQFLVDINELPDKCIFLNCYFPYDVPLIEFL